MTRTVTISDDLAARLEQRRAESGFASLDAAAEALIAYGLAADDVDDDHMDGRSAEDIRGLIAGAEASGPVVDWDPKAVKAEVLRRYAERDRQP